MLDIIIPNTNEFGNAVPVKFSELGGLSSCYKLLALNNDSLLIELSCDNAKRLKSFSTRFRITKTGVIELQVNNDGNDIRSICKPVNISQYTEKLEESDYTTKFKTKITGKTLEVMFYNKMMEGSRLKKITIKTNLGDFKLLLSEHVAALPYFRFVGDVKFTDVNIVAE